MKNTTRYSILLLIVLIYSCQKNKRLADNALVFPDKLVKFELLQQDSIFGGTGSDSWDKVMRERGFIMKEGDEWRLYYSGYNPDSSEVKYLGLATSKDGINWVRYSQKPIFSEDWVEDMHVVKDGGIYYMFAEGRNDIPHWLTSKDGIHWHNEGNLKILKKDAKTLITGSVGTPTVWIEDGTWYLFYEMHDQGIWLATTKDPKQWQNFSDDPVIAMGESYDKYAVAANCIVKDNGLYYTYYHAADDSLWSRWTVNAAVSSDLYHWKKYDKNPIIGYDNSSPIVLKDGSKYRLYTMHPVVHIYESEK